MTAGSGIVPPPEGMDLARFACLLRDAARASARSWAGPMDRTGQDRAVRQLGRAVWDLRTVTARLAVRYRLQAVCEQRPAAFARAAAVHASAQVLGQAWLILEAAQPASPALPGPGSCGPADLMCYAAMRAAAWRKPVTSLDQAAQPLAEALAALAGGAALLAAGIPQPRAAHLTATQACLAAAATQLGGIRPARPPRGTRPRVPETDPGHPRHPATPRPAFLPPRPRESPC
jgi:hypothetical protein